MGKESVDENIIKEVEVSKGLEEGVDAIKVNYIEGHSSKFSRHLREF